MKQLIVIILIIAASQCDIYARVCVCGVCVSRRMINIRLSTKYTKMRFVIYTSTKVN